jgi:hypothetical protein
MLDYWTEMLNGALAKAAASASMPMPSYNKKVRNINNNTVILYKCLKRF